MGTANTKTDTLDSVAEDLFCIPPLVGRSIRRKLLRTALADMHAGILPPHLEIMKILEEAGTLHVAEISDRLQIPRPQMTHLIDRLAGLGMVERRTNPSDRRAIDITLTSDGRKVLRKHERLMRNALRTTLSGLTGEELEEMSISLRKLRDILSRL
ncbi:MAG TPA: MarR family transcriptional regulator [Dehalococcoidales bacterium]|nr:MarR family transcriptional regulator [Dehalococcoidales bacterium]